MLASPERHTEIAATIPNAQLTLEVCVDGSSGWDVLSRCSDLFERSGVELCAVKCSKEKVISFRVACPHAATITVLESEFSSTSDLKVLRWSVTIGRTCKNTEKK